jgi:hypothetical protein
LEVHKKLQDRSRTLTIRPGIPGTWMIPGVKEVGYIDPIFLTPSESDATVLRTRNKHLQGRCLKVTLQTRDWQTWEFSYRVPQAYFKNFIGSSKIAGNWHEWGNMVESVEACWYWKSSFRKCLWVWRSLNVVKVASERLRQPQWDLIWQLMILGEPYKILVTWKCGIVSKMVPHLLCWVPQACLPCLRLFTSLVIGPS